MLWTMQCPHCGSKRLRRSARRSLIEKTLTFFVLPYRCVPCDRRFYRIRFCRPRQTQHEVDASER